MHVTHNLGQEWPERKAWDFGPTIATAAQLNNATEEAFPAKETSCTVPAEASSVDRPYSIALKEELLPEGNFPAGKSFSKDGPLETQMSFSQAAPEASLAELVVKDFDNPEKHIPNQHDNISQASDNLYKPLLEPNIAPVYSTLVKGSESVISSPTSTLCATRHKSDSQSSPLLPSSSIVTSVPKAAVAQVEPTEDGHTIMLKILTLSSQVLRAIVYTEVCTQTAILSEARAYCLKSAQDDRILGTLLAKGFDLDLVSLYMHGYEMDLSIYKIENLFSLVKAVEKTEIPIFTVRVSEIQKYGGNDC